MRHDLTLSTADASEQHVLSVPTTWDDVSVQQYLDWQSSDQPALCALAGLTQAQLERLPLDEAGYLLNLLAFATEQPDSPASPDLVDVGSATYGEMLLVQQHLAAHPDQPEIWYAPYLYALYRSRQVYGVVSDEKLEQMRAAVLEQPIGQVMGDLLFTYAAWRLSTSATPRTPRTLPSPTTTKAKLGWRNWLRGLGFCSPSTV